LPWQQKEVIRTNLKSSSKDPHGIELIDILHMALPIASLPRWLKL
jgi:hypothetical protein